jgi:hypothetical protein
MTTFDGTQGPPGSGPPPGAMPPEGESPPNKPPTMALRTYRFLRIGVIGMILLLAISLALESHQAGACLQGSISAYYFTPVRSVFVGALVALGFTLIALWGKTPAEDALLNLAGLLAPVVAFVPTGETNLCGLRTAEDEAVDTNKEATNLVDASQEAVLNNLRAYALVVLLVMIGLAIAGYVANRNPRKWPAISQNKKAYWFPLVIAAVLWAFGVVVYLVDDQFFFDWAHGASAVGLFIFIVLAIFAIARARWQGRPEYEVEKDTTWALRYVVLGLSMSVGVVMFALIVRAIDLWEIDKDHITFWVEAWMIALLAVFWALQTWERWTDGAPPRTKAEEERAELALTEGT